MTNHFMTKFLHLLTTYPESKSNKLRPIEIQQKYTRKIAVNKSHK